MAYGTVKITPTTILSQISEEEIIEHYLGYEVNYNKIFTNPLRDDNDAGCKFYISDKTSRIKFRDFAEGWDEDCFGIVMRAERCNFPTALEKIAKYFNLFGLRSTNEDGVTTLYNSTNKKARSRAKITVRLRNWNLIDAKFWKSIYLNSIDLEEGNVKPIKLAWLDNHDDRGTRLIYDYKDSDPCYGYIYPDKTIKLYYPFRETGRFLGNSKYIQGYDLLPKEGDHCIITKSYKDVLCMKKFGLISLAPQAESMIIEPELYIELKQRFTNLYSLYDWDRAGIRGAIKMRDQYKIEPLFFTKKGLVKVKTDFVIKDFAENLSTYGIQDTNDIIEYTKIKLGFEEFIKELDINLDKDYVPF